MKLIEKPLIAFLFKFFSEQSEQETSESKLRFDLSNRTKDTGFLEKNFEEDKRFR